MKHWMIGVGVLVLVLSGALWWRLSDAGVWIRIITHRLYVNWGHQEAVSDTVAWLTPRDQRCHGVSRGHHPGTLRRYSRYCSP